MRARYEGPRRMLEHGVRGPPLPIHLAGRFPPPTSSLIWEQRPDVQGLTHSLLSGSSMMLESSCGQRETASTRYHSQTSGCLLASALTRHVWSARPFSLSSLPQASPTLKKKTRKETTTPNPFQPPPPPSLCFTSTWNESSLPPGHSPTHCN